MYIGGIFYILLVFIIKWIHAYCKKIFLNKKLYKAKNDSTYSHKILFCVLHIYICV